MIKKVFNITLIIFIFITIYTIPNIVNYNNISKVDLEINKIINISNSKVYLLNNNNLLVKVDTYIDGNNKIDIIKNIIEYLKVDNYNNDSSLHGYIPSNTKVLNVDIDDDYLKLDLSLDFLNYDNNYSDIIRSGLIHSLLEIDNINEVSITIEGQYYKGYTKVFDNSLGINNIYSINNRKDIDRVVIYYLDDNGKYYIPITKYINSSSEKIEVIIDELRFNRDNNLISTISYNTKLIDYYEESGVLFLDFNNELLNGNEDMMNETFNLIAYSVFDNYDVGMVMFEVEDRVVKQIKKS